MPIGKTLTIRQIGPELFSASEWSTEPSAPGSIGMRSHTLIWASNNMPRQELIAALEQRNWPEQEIARQLMLALKAGPEV